MFEKAEVKERIKLCGWTVILNTPASTWWLTSRGVSLCMLKPPELNSIANLSVGIVEQRPQTRIERLQKATRGQHKVSTLQTFAFFVSCYFESVNDGN